MEQIFEAEFSCQDKQIDVSYFEAIALEKGKVQRETERVIYEHIFKRISYFINCNDLTISTGEVQNKQLIPDILECILPTFLVNNVFGKLVKELDVVKYQKKSPECDTCEMEFLIIFFLKTKSKKYKNSVMYRMLDHSDNSKELASNNNCSSREVLRVQLFSKLEECEENFLGQIDSRIQSDVIAVRRLLTELATLLISKSVIKVNDLANSPLILALDKGLTITSYEAYEQQFPNIKQSFAKLIKTMLEKGVLLTRLSGENFLHCCPYASDEGLWSLFKDKIDINTIINSKCNKQRTPLETTLYYAYLNRFFPMFKFFSLEMEALKLHINNLIKHGANIHSALIVKNYFNAFYWVRSNFYDERDVSVIDITVALYQAGMSLKRDIQTPQDNTEIRDITLEFKDFFLKKIATVTLWKELLTFLYYCLGIDFPVSGPYVTPEMKYFLATFSVRSLEEISAQVVRENLLPNAVCAVDLLPLPETIQKLIVADKYFQLNLEQIVL